MTELCLSLGQGSKAESCMIGAEMQSTLKDSGIINTSLNLSSTLMPYVKGLKITWKWVFIWKRIVHLIWEREKGVFSKTWAKWGKLPENPLKSLQFRCSEWERWSPGALPDTCMSEKVWSSEVVSSCPEGLWRASCFVYKYKLNAYIHR